MRREAHNPHARSGGSTALICRKVSPLTAAAPRERMDPRAGIVSVITSEVQQRLVTFVNVNISACEIRLTPVRGVRLALWVAGPGEAVDVFAHVKSQL
jgi:hypothetical protein